MARSRVTETPCPVSPRSSSSACRFSVKWSTLPGAFGTATSFFGRPIAGTLDALAARARAHSSPRAFFAEVLPSSMR